MTVFERIKNVTATPANKAVWLWAYAMLHQKSAWDETDLTHKVWNEIVRIADNGDITYVIQYISNFYEKSESGLMKFFNKRKRRKWWKDLISQFEE